MIERPRRRYTCKICGGPAVRRMNAATRVGYEALDAPLLHVRQVDWADNPHDVIPTDDGVVIPR